MDYEPAPLSERMSGIEAPAEAEAPPVVEAEPENNGPARDEAGRFAPKNAGEAAEQPQEGPPPSAAEPQHVPLAALQDERTKRQRAEDEYRDAQMRLQQYEAYFQQQTTPQPDPESDPIAFVAQAVREQLAPQLQQELLAQRVQVTESMARRRWSDYDEKIELFKAEAVRNPFLWQQVQSADDPATYAYNVANQIADAQRYGGQPAATREQIEAELREKIMAEIGMSNRQAPATLATERSTGARGGPAWSGPATLSEKLRY